MRILSCLLFIVLFSCKGGQRDPLGMKMPPEKCITELFFSDPSSDFGKYRVGMTRAAFDDAGNTSVIYRAVEEVIDSIPLCRNEGLYAEVSFRFFDAFLSDIDVHFYLNTDDELNNIMRVCQKDLNSKFGEPVIEQGIISWRKERGSRIVQVYLSDDSVAFGRQVIHLLFYSEGKLSV